MAAHSNRSTSPFPSKPTANNCPIRTSFTGNNLFVKPSVLNHPRRLDPDTPSNTTLDGLRRSLGKERMCAASGEWEEKENVKDNNSNVIKASKLRNTGSKNFMSPTISAASKFTPSPKKRVLMERNDPVRTSISLSDGKAIFFSSPNVSQDLGSKHDIFSEKQDIVPPLSSKPQKKVTFLEVPLDSSQHSSPESLSESVITDSGTDNTNLHPISFSSASVMSPIAPLDADPSLPPYDPKTNYLSPRPRFLHYKPNPRIEILFKKEMGLGPDGILEDSFFSELMIDNSSDSEDASSEVSTLANDSVIEELHVTNPECSADMVVLGMVEDDLLQDVLPLGTTTVPVLHKREKKQWGGFSKFLCFSVVLVFLISCLIITSDHSTTLDQPYLQGMSYADVSKFYHQSGIANSIKPHYERLVGHMNEFSINTVAFVSRLVNGVLGEGNNVALPVQFMNLSDLQKDIWDDGIFLKDNLSSELVLEPQEGDDVGTEMDVDDMSIDEEFDNDVEFEVDKPVSVEEEINSDGSYEVVLENQEYKAELDLQHIMLESTSELQLKNQEIGSEATSVEEAIHSDGVSEIQLNEETNKAELELKNQDIVEIPDQITSVHDEIKVVAETTAEVEEIFRGEKIADSSVFADVTALNKQENQLEYSSVNEGPQSSPVLEEKQKFLANSVIIGISSLALSLCAIGVFVHQKKTNHVFMQNEPALNKQTEKPFSPNWQTEVDDDCASEMSSFQKNYSKKSAKRESENMERVLRKNTISKRESLASSTGSPSYGSFTTFERIPIKNANVEDEIITPVRRSSRIRKQVTSPSQIAV